MSNSITNQDNFKPSPGKTAVEISDFRPLEKGSLRGFVTVRIPAIRLTIKDVSVHASHGRWWVSLPAKAQLDNDKRQVEKDGKPQYVNLLQFDTRIVADAFSAAVLRELDALPQFKR